MTNSLASLSRASVMIKKMFAYHWISNTIIFGAKMQLKQGNDSISHRYRKSQNRLLKVCCVPATSAGLPRVSFFFSFLFFLLQWPFTVLIKQTRHAVR